MVNNHRIKESIVIRLRKKSNSGMRNRLNQDNAISRIVVARVDCN